MGHEGDREHGRERMAETMRMKHGEEREPDGRSNGQVTEMG